MGCTPRCDSGDSRGGRSKKPLSGEGGLYASGRWHKAPRRIIYTSASLALASLEILVHVDPDLARDLVAVAIDVPESVAVAQLNVRRVAEILAASPAPRSLQKLGDAWLDGLTAAVLCVPSALVPSELHYLLNPLHPDARHFKVAAETPFAFDPRLLHRGRSES